MLASPLIPCRKQKDQIVSDLAFSLNIGRDGVIRTLDPLHPMQVRYQAALRPDDAYRFPGERIAL